MNGVSSRRGAYSAAALFLGASVGALVCGALLLLSSFVFVKLGAVPTGAAPVITTAIGAAGAFSAGWFALKLLKSRGLLMGAAAGLLMFISVLIAGVIAKTQPDVSSALLKCAIFVISGAIGGIMRVNKRVVPADGSRSRFFHY